MALPKHRRQIRAVMWNLRIDAATGEVVCALREAGIDSLVLKGPAFADWYPPDSGRTYVDGDIWVPPDRVADAEAVLTELSFTPTVDERGLPEWWQEHASSWLRHGDQGKIDLHRRLQGVGIGADRAWLALWPRRVALTVGGVPAHRLCVAGRALYATLHAAHHGVGDVRGLQHLEAALAAVDDAAWSEALALAREVEAVDAFGAGLRLLAAGARLAERLELPATRSVRTTLLASTPPPIALGLDQLSSAERARRPQILLRKLLPPPGFIRHWWPPARANTGMLIVGYLYRPIWLLRRAPAGYRAWRAARRAAGSSA